MSGNSDVDNDVVGSRLIGPWQIEGNATLLAIICSTNWRLFFFVSFSFRLCPSDASFTVWSDHYSSTMVGDIFPFEQSKHYFRMTTKQRTSDVFFLVFLLETFNTPSVYRGMWYEVENLRQYSISIDVYCLFEEAVNFSRNRWIVELMESK